MTRTRTTYTFAELEVSPATYDEIRQLLEEAGYRHAFLDGGAIDMHGIGLVRGETGPSQGHAALRRFEDAVIECAGTGRGTAEYPAAKAALLRLIPSASAAPLAAPDPRHHDCTGCRGFCDCHKPELRKLWPADTIFVCGA